MKGIRDLHGGPSSDDNASGGMNPSSEELGEMGKGEAEDIWATGIEQKTIEEMTTYAGLLLCIGLFVYLHHIAKKALCKAQMEAERERGMEEGEGGMVELGGR